MTSQLSPTIDPAYPADLTGETPAIPPKRSARKVSPAASAQPAASGASAQPLTPPRSTGLFGVRTFRTYWIGQAVALLGDQFSLLAFPWLVLQLTGNALAMGSALALMSIPRALLTLLGGALIDRFSPRSVLLASTAGRLGAVSLLALLTLTGSIQVWMLYAIGLAFGVIDAFAYPSGSAILPRLVPAALLPQANALTQGTQQIALFLGPVLAGTVIAALSGYAAAGAAAGLFGIGIAFVVDAAGFLVALITLALVRTDDSSARAGQPDETVLQAIRSGLVFVWNDAPLRAYFILIAGINLLVSGPFAVGLPLLAQTRLPEGVTALGIVMSAYGGGSLLGIVGAGALKVPFERQTRLMTLLIGVLGLGLVVFGLSGSTALIAAVSVAMGMANGYVVVQFITWLQKRTPPAMLGRTMGLLMFAAVGLQPISNALAGAIASFHLAALFVGSGTLLIGLVLLSALNPSLRDVGNRDAGSSGIGNDADPGDTSASRANGMAGLRDPSLESEAAA